MTTTERNVYEIQTVKMCIQTYFNLFGVMPGVQDMIDWLGESYAKVVPLYLNTQAAA